MAYCSVTASVLDPSGIDPSVADCCVCRYAIACDAGSTCATAVLLPIDAASIAAPNPVAVAKATTLLVLHMSVPHAARDSTLLESSSPHEASSRLARGWRSTLRVGLLTCGSTPIRPPSRERSRWHDGRWLPAHSCATAPDFHRLPVTRSVIQLSASSMRAVLRGSSRGLWVH